MALPSPTPGGGSAAALAGALAAALVEMVAGLTLKKTDGSRAKMPLADILKRAHWARRRLLLLSGRDALAYEDVVRAYRLGEPRKITSALKKATLIPLEVWQVGKSVRSLGREIFRVGRKSARADAQTAWLLAGAAREAARINVQVNLKALRKFPRTEGFVTKVRALLRP